nr:pre-mrna-splicing factor cef1 [Quercus suber]
MPVVKGGVWTNIEDEILKAAVSKYGLNQWARVASLLARKTAKQCKARWAEWLDPGIRKIEWSREEDEKLLHLAKLMPTQWRTIAPIVGRTATQCLERYQKLLDEAEARENAGELGLGGPEGGETSAPSADDVRRLRPGELDPDPESKPARPDTIDLDEDEKEMLSEARARLANTQGKKAKRKARERQLEESRRLAVLQKRRELKNAGINIKVTTKKKGQMDYNADIPFEKAPAAGFYDTQDELARNEYQREMFDPRKQQLANKRKGDAQEDDGQSTKRRKNERDGGAAAFAAAAKAGQLQRIREAEQSSKRRSLTLPAPQVSENELEDIVKMGMSGERASQSADMSENYGTRGLIGTYTNTVGATPIRTPRAPQEEDRISNELRDARARTATQSALLGGENTPMADESSTTGYGGVAPSKQAIFTPNPLATPMRGASHAGTSATPLRTPRDSFKLNADDGSVQLLQQTPLDIRLREQTMRSDIRSKLASLPKPKEVEWELELPEEQRELDAGSDRHEREDAAVRDQRNADLAHAAAVANFKRQTSVVQKGLPRPKVADPDALLKSYRVSDDPVSHSVAEEAALLMLHDSINPDGGKGTQGLRPLQAFADDALQAAQMEVISEMGQNDQRTVFGEAFNREWDTAHSNTILPGLAGYAEDEIDEHQLLTEAFDTLQESMSNSAEKSKTLEKKLVKVHGGYMERQKKLKAKILEAAGILETTKLDSETTRFKIAAEEAGMSERLEQGREEVAFVAKREREAQELYRERMMELENPDYNLTNPRSEVARGRLRTISRPQNAETPVREFHDKLNAKSTVMARKARQRISYVLPLANAAGGHRLGVNGLAVDSINSILYSGGRDGVICAWDLGLDLENPRESEWDDKPASSIPPTTFRQQVQAHTHWINDIALAQQNQILLSASSDITVKVWRPAASDQLPPQSVGLHSDYVKTLAVPSPTSDWVVSGGLDRKICAWDLSGAGQRLQIDVGEDEAGNLSSKEKGSVYALAATEKLLASGGPEGTVRVWDARSGKRITKLVGHTDNIRDVLISQDGSTILTASSDQTVKVWSTGAGRCMYTLTMHDASVWSLFSADPGMSVFYSSDKHGVVAKTDTRDVIELDEGMSVAVAQEHEGVHKVVVAGDYIWTATSRPSINRWRNVNTEHAEIDIPEGFNSHRGSVVSLAKLRYPNSPNRSEKELSSHHSGMTGMGKRRKLPLKHMLRLSNTAFFPTPLRHDGDRRSSVQTVRQAETVAQQPVRAQPDSSIEGQNGLIKHVMLNDRKRVLTLDTAGEVLMWDLLKCVPIRSYGKRHLEDVKDEVTTTTTVANWCTVDTRTGSVAVVLEENTCFDAELYADELDVDENIEFREDQRINLGKWVLRYLFSDLITEEIKRDQQYRRHLMNSREQQRLQRANAPTSIQLPPEGHLNGWHQGDNAGPLSASTLRPTMNTMAKVTTPGMAIGLATPAIMGSPLKSEKGGMSLAPTAEEGTTASRSSAEAPRKSSERSNLDYFSSNALTANSDMASQARAPITPGETGQEEPQTQAASDAKDGTSGMFGKKFRMNMSAFTGMKKLGRTVTGDSESKANKTSAPDRPSSDAESDSHSSQTSHSRVIDDTLLGTVQKIRFGYEDSLQQQNAGSHSYENGLPAAEHSRISVSTAITPSLPQETPVLKPPANTTILIQEDRPEAGGVADLFEGTVGSLGEKCDLLEKCAPMWLGEVLLRNQIPHKEVVKISFCLEPWKGENGKGAGVIGGILPSIAADGNNRLNANRMLRAKKIMAYIAERIEPQDEVDGMEQAIENALKPEEYLELLCQGQIVPQTMTLATMRSHLWRGGGDIILFYRSNGKKQIKHLPVQPPSPAPVLPQPQA